MSIRKKILSAIFLCVFITAFCITLFTILELNHIKSNMIDFMNGQNEVLLNNNIDKITKLSGEIVEDFAESNTDTLNSELNYLGSELTFLKNIIKDMYNKGSINSKFDASECVIFKENINFSEVRDEFSTIGGIRDIIYNMEDTSFYGTYYYATESGITFIGKRLEDPNKTFEDLTQRDWYTNAVNKGDFYWSDLYVDILTGKQTLTCSLPIYLDDGTLKGVLGVDIYLEDVAKNLMVNVNKSYAIDYTFLMKSNGTFIKGNSEENLLKYLSEEAILQLTELMQENSKTAVLLDDKYILYCGYSSEQFDLRIGFLVSYDKIISSSQETSSFINESNSFIIDKLNKDIKFIVFLFLIIFCVSISISLFVALFVTKTLVDPIKALIRGTEIISDGNLDYSIDIKTKDEIHELSTSFNSMNQKLKKYINNLSQVVAENERIETELNVATTIQSSMLPCIFPPFPKNEEFDIFASMRPAKEVGGDFYDFFFIDDDHLAFVVADVSGKGVPAALFMVITKTLIKNNMQNLKDPAEVLKIVNNQLCESNEANMFVTAFLGILNIKTGELTYSNAGHNPPLLFMKKEQSYDYIKIKPNFILAAINNVKYINESLVLNKGDQIFCYTDGVTEAMDKDKNIFTPERLKEILNVACSKGLSIKEILEHVSGEIEEFSDNEEQTDDITMLAIEKT